MWIERKLQEHHICIGIPYIVQKQQLLHYIMIFPTYLQQAAAHSDSLLLIPDKPSAEIAYRRGISFLFT